MTPEKLRVAREKLTRVFRYLEALNQHRNPAKRQIREQLWSLWLHDLPEHASIKRGASKSSTAKTKAADSQNGDASAGGFVLKVQRRRQHLPSRSAATPATSVQCRSTRIHSVGSRPPGRTLFRSLPIHDRCGRTRHRSLPRRVGAGRLSSAHQWRHLRVSEAPGC